MSNNETKYHAAGLDATQRKPYYLDNPIVHAQEIIEEVGRISYLLSFTLDMAAHHGFIQDMPPMACQGLSDLQSNICVLTERAENLLTAAKQELDRARQQIAEKEC